VKGEAMKRLAVVLALLLGSVSCGGGQTFQKVLDDGIEARSGIGAGKAKATGQRNAIQPRGRFHFTHIRAGRVLASFSVPNLVTDAGKAGVASRINGSGAEAQFAHIAIGTGTTAAAAGDTALQTEISTGGGARAACTTSRVTTDVTNDTAQCVVTFTFTATFAVTEAGYFNAASAGTLLARQVFAAVNVVSGDSLSTTYKVDVD
jgi:hypothetical protein